MGVLPGSGMCMDGKWPCCLFLYLGLLTNLLSDSSFDGIFVEKHKGYLIPNGLNQGYQQKSDLRRRMKSPLLRLKEIGRIVLACFALPAIEGVYLFFGGFFWMILNRTNATAQSPEILCFPYP